jgi:hypothetical protein
LAPLGVPALRQHLGAKGTRLRVPWGRCSDLGQVVAASMHAQQVGASRAERRGATHPRIGSAIIGPRRQRQPQDAPEDEQRGDWGGGRAVGGMHSHADRVGRGLPAHQSCTAGAHRRGAKEACAWPLVLAAAPCPPDTATELDSDRDTASRRRRREDDAELSVTVSTAEHLRREAQGAAWARAAVAAQGPCSASAHSAEVRSAHADTSRRPRLAEQVARQGRTSFPPQLLPVSRERGVARRRHQALARPDGHDGGQARPGDGLAVSAGEGGADADAPSIAS